MALQSKTITGSTNNSNWTWKMEVIENSTNTSANTSSVTVNSYLGRASSASYFGGNASVNITCNGTSRSASKTFTYPTNVSGGGWVLVQSETFTITHNSDGSKDISISSSMSTGDFTPSSASASGSMTLTKIPRYANITSFVVNKRDETSVTFSVTADATLDYIWYSKDNGSNWSGLPTNNIVTGLSANTSYNFKVRVRRKDSQLTTDSGTYKQTTYDYPYCTESPNFTIGNALTLKFYNPLSRKIAISIVTDNGSSYGVDTITGTTITGYNNAGWQDNWYKSIPNKKSGKYQVKVTYGSVIKTRNNSNTYSINENACIPSVGDISYKDINENTIAITQDNQRIIRNHSKLLFSIGSATPKNYASISKYEVTIGGVTKSRTSVGDLDFGTMNLAQSANATLKITDSRGISNTKQINVVIDNWELPTALIDLKRKNNFYSETYFKVDGTCSYLNGKNELNIKYQYKKVSDTDYSSLTAIDDNKQVTLDLDNNYQWNIKAILTDKLGTTTYNATLERGMPITYFDRVKNSVGINCFPKYDENVELNGETLKGSIVVSDTEPKKSEDVWLQKGANLFDGKIELGNLNIDGDGGNLDSSSRTRSVNYIKVKPNTTYIYKRTEITGYRWVLGYDANKKIINNGNCENQGTIMTGAIMKMNVGINELTFTTTDTTEYIRWYDTTSTNTNEIVTIEEYVKKIHTKSNNGVYEEFCDINNLMNAVSNMYYFKTFYKAGSTFDANDLIDNGLYVLDVNNTISNRPTKVVQQLEFLLVFTGSPNGKGSNAIQLWFNGTGALYYRLRSWSSFGAWKKITIT